MKTYNIEAEVTLHVVTSREFESDLEAEEYAEGLTAPEYDPHDFEVLSVSDIEVVDVWSVDA